MSSNTFSLQDLADQTGVELRTIRSYIQTGLLPRPSSSGRGAFYGIEHLNRLKAMRVLREQEHLSLDEVRAFFLTSSEQEIASKAASLISLPLEDSTRSEDSSSALDYLQDLKQSLGGSWTGSGGSNRPPKTGPRPNHQQSSPAEMRPVQRAIAILSTLMNQSRPHAGTRPATWQRFEIVPGVELHIDSGLGVDGNEIARLCDYIREFLQGG